MQLLALAVTVAMPLAECQWFAVNASRIEMACHYLHVEWSIVLKVWWANCFCHNFHVQTKSLLPKFVW